MTHAPSTPTAAHPYRNAPTPRAQGLFARGRTRHRGDIALTAAGLGLGISLGIGVHAVQPGMQYPGGAVLAAGTLAALAGTYLSLCLLLLVSRLPWIEREVGHDRLVWLHRKVAPYSLVLIAAHVVLTTVSYAQAAETGVLAQFLDIVLHTGWMMPALAGFILMIALGVISYRRLRARMRYETWWVAHLYFYIAVALAFGHQVTAGPMFVANGPARWFWIGLYILVGTAILLSRFVMPLVVSARHGFRVAAVVPEADGVVSVYVTGKDLDLLRARGGQFFQWRFLTRHWWWQAHPYSLSASPNPSWLRITVKALGDHSSLLGELVPGTRVWAEGPYGVFTAAARHSDRVVAVAAGVGITPIRAMLDDLPAHADVTLLYRVPDAASAALSDEIAALASAHGWRAYRLEGSSSTYRMSPELLAQAAPDVATADVYVCGPEAFMQATVSAARHLGVPKERIHHETFAF